MPVGFLHFNAEMTGRLLKIRKRQIPFGVRDATDLVKPRHRIAHMRRIGHRLFADAGKGKGRGRQRSFLRHGKAARRFLAIRFPSGIGKGFFFHCGFRLGTFTSLSVRKDFFQ